MKTAQTVKGEPIAASATAPRQAICLRCGGEVTLRHRHRMNNMGVVYFWRHHSNRNLKCGARARPVG
jgi:hypothetical protein